MGAGNITEPLARTRALLAADYLRLDAAYSDLFASCSRERLVTRPAHGSWSIAECIEHVALVNWKYLRSIKEAIAKAKPAAPEGESLLSPGGWLSAAFLKRIGPQVTLKFKAPSKIRPRSIDPGQALQELLRGHAEIQTIVAAPTRLDLNRIRFTNPIFPVMRFTVSTGLLLMAAHGRRHLLQAERICKAGDSLAGQRVA